METEKFRGLMASLVAALAVIGGAIGAVFVWLHANDVVPPRDLALIFGVMTGLIGSGTTFLFMSDAGSRASHASERSFASGSDSGKTLPEQAVTTPITSASLEGAPPAPDPDPTG